MSEAEKEAMLSKSNKYVAKVEQAIAKCKDAKTQIERVVSTVESNWQGDSATAMITALEAQDAELSQVITQLSYAAEEMRSQASSIYSSWPAETEESSDTDG